jgi:hypothetical protein
MPLDKDSLEVLVQLEEDMKNIAKGADPARRSKANRLYGKSPTEEEKQRIDIVRDYFSSGGGGGKSSKAGKPVASKDSQPSVDVKSLQLSLEVCKVLAKSLDSKKIKWDRVALNMGWLGQDAASGGTYYAHFFDELSVLWAKLDPKHIAQMKGGLENQLIKLSGTSDKIASLGNYKGAAAEFIDGVRSAFLRKDILTLIKIPEAMKKIDKDLTQAMPDKSNNVLSEQDIDRLEVYTNGTKVYIEVKADVETATDKHGKTFPKLQLLQILNVIATAERKDVRKGQERERLPAVAIVNHAEWLRLFTAGTALVYASLGFHLMIGGACFTPAQLRLIHSVITRESAGREKEFFHANIEKFPAPALVLKGIDDLESLLELKGLPLPIKSAQSRFVPKASEKDDWDPRKDPIIIKSNQPTGKFGPIGPSSKSLVVRSSSPPPRRSASPSGFIRGPMAIEMSSSAKIEVLDELMALQMYLEQFQKAVKHVPELSASEKLVQQLKFKHTFHAILADGNCLFRAIGFLLFRSQEQHKFMRATAVGHMKRYGVVFSNIDPQINEAYLRVMSTPARDASELNRYGGYPELYAFSRVFRRSIFVHHPSFRDGQLEIREHDDARFTPLPDRKPLHLYFKGGNHYEAMQGE